MKAKYGAVLWDWDGTLFDSDQEIWRAHSLALEWHNYATEEYAVFRHREGNGLSRCLEYDAPEGKADEVRRTFYEYFDTSKCDLVECASDVLLHLNRLAIPCGIVSAHKVEEIFVSLRHFKINHHFPFVVGDMRDKRNALVEACEVFNVLPSEALFVGDLLSDVLDGNAAGLITVLLAPADYPFAAQAHHHITDLKQLIPILDF